VRLVTQGIRRITPAGIETEDGHMHAVDAIVYGTGFAATEFLAPLTVTGRDGKDLNTAWAQGAKAYLGMTVPGFPNFFMLYGPNTNLGHNSILFMIESQIRHVMGCLKAMDSRHARTMEVAPGAYDQFTANVQSRLAHTVWNGCSSWYLDARGYNSTNWPGFTLSYRWLTKTVDPEAYRFQTSVSR
jgi:cation diffusion facilitator CzcD-associated flavoprotein CzcO